MVPVYRALHDSNGEAGPADAHIAVSEHLEWLWALVKGGCRCKGVIDGASAVAGLERVDALVQVLLGKGDPRRSNRDDQASERQQDPAGAARRRAGGRHAPRRGLVGPGLIRAGFAPRKRRPPGSEEPEGHGRQVPVPVDASRKRPQQPGGQEQPVDGPVGAADADGKAGEDGHERDQQQRQAEEAQLVEGLQVQRVRVYPRYGKRAVALPLQRKRARPLAGDRAVLEAAPRNFPVVHAARVAGIGETDAGRPPPLPHGSPQSGRTGVRGSRALQATRARGGWPRRRFRSWRARARALRGQSHCNQPSVGPDQAQPPIAAHPTHRATIQATRCPWATAALLANSGLARRSAS